MGRKRLEPSSKKVSCSINLELWMWNWVDSLEGNRSEFFRNLLKEEIKKELIEQCLMSDDDEVSETLGEIYKNIQLYKRKLTVSVSERKLIRSRPVKKKLPVEMSRKAVSLTIEKWLWEIAGSVEHNRSLFFKNLLLNKIEIKNHTEAS